jgi:hypothetical protein
MGHLFTQIPDRMVRPGDHADVGSGMNKRLGGDKDLRVIVPKELRRWTSGRYLRVGNTSQIEPQQKRAPLICRDREKDEN